MLRSPTHHCLSSSKLLAVVAGAKSCGANIISDTLQYILNPARARLRSFSDPAYGRRLAFIDEVPIPVSAGYQDLP